MLGAFIEECCTHRRSGRVKVKATVLIGAIRPGSSEAEMPTTNMDFIAALELPGIHVSVAPANQYYWHGRRA